MTYINGIGYVDERSYNASKKITSSNTDEFSTILQKETIIYATPEVTDIEKPRTSGAYSVPTELESYFEKAAQTYGVDINLLEAVAKQESNFDANAVSSVGASGVMQLMPETARGLGVTDIMDPEQNIMGGAKYLSQMLNLFNGDVSLALAGYNAGPGNVKKYGGIPPFQETTNYVNSVLSYLGTPQLEPVNQTSVSATDTADDNVSTIYAVAKSDATQTQRMYSIMSQKQFL